MNSALVLAFFGAVFVAVAQGGDVEDHSIALMAEFDAIKCNPGFKELPKGLHMAFETCKAKKTASCSCFGTCVLRERGNINVANNMTSEIDHGMIDVNMMQYFMMDTHEGRMSYHRVSSIEHKCGEIFAAHKGKRFAMTYDNAKDCMDAEYYLKCFTRAFMC